MDHEIAEHFIGHNFGLDNAYLHINHDLLKKEYMKAADDFTFLLEKQVTSDNIRQELEQLRLAVQMLKDAQGIPNQSEDKRR